MHTAVHLQVDGVVALAGPAYSLRKGVQGGEVVDFGFKPVGGHQQETVGIGIEHHDGHCDTFLSQLHALVGKGYGEVVHSLVGQRGGNLIATVAITRSLHHSHKPCALGQHTAIEVEVGHHCGEVHLQHSGVALARECVHKAVEARHLVPLDEHRSTLNLVLREGGKEFVHRGVELALHLEVLLVGSKVFAHADELAHSGPVDEFGHAGVEPLLRQGAVGYVRKYHHLAPCGCHVL